MLSARFDPNADPSLRDQSQHRGAGIMADARAKAWLNQQANSGPFAVDRRFVNGSWLYQTSYLYKSQPVPDRFSLPDSFRQLLCRPSLPFSASLLVHPPIYLSTTPSLPHSHLPCRLHLPTHVHLTRLHLQALPGNAHAQTHHTVQEGHVFEVKVDGPNREAHRAKGRRKINVQRRCVSRSDQDAPPARLHVKGQGEKGRDPKQLDPN
jgi:hypothetical protein